jgi:hypothetical protein
MIMATIEQYLMFCVDMAIRQDAGMYYTYPNKTGMLRSWNASATNDNRIRAQDSGKIHIQQGGLYEIIAQVTFFKRNVTLYSRGGQPSLTIGPKIWASNLLKAQIVKTNF